MAEGGVDKISYLTVTSGADKYCTFNTYATDRIVQKGEYVLVDISGHIDGYASDLTRVFYLGHAPEEEREMAEVASGCVRTAMAAMKPGVPVGDINRICEGYIKNSKFGKFLLHSSGHCIGLNVVGIQRSMTMRQSGLRRVWYLRWKMVCIHMICPRMLNQSIFLLEWRTRLLSQNMALSGSRARVKH